MDDIEREVILYDTSRTNSTSRKVGYLAAMPLDKFKPFTQRKKNGEEQSARQEK